MPNVLMMKRGDTKRFNIVVANPDGSPANLTDVGTKLWFTAKANLALADGALGVIQKTYFQAGGGSGINLTGSPTPGATGTAQIVISPSDTSTLSPDQAGTVFFADLQWHDPTTGDTVTVWPEDEAVIGELIVYSDVTQSS